jgi:hypothetical protein
MISPALARQMLTRQSGDDGYAFGLGLMLDQTDTAVSVSVERSDRRG